MTFDPLWLAITRAFHPQLSLQHQQAPLPQNPTIVKGLIDRELAWVTKTLPQAGAIPVIDVQQFVKTAPAPNDPGGDDPGPRALTGVNKLRRADIISPQHHGIQVNKPKL